MSEGVCGCGRVAFYKVSVGKEWAFFCDKCKPLAQSEARRRSAIAQVKREARYDEFRIREARQNNDRTIPGRLRGRS